MAALFSSMFGTAVVESFESEAAAVAEKVDTVAKETAAVAEKVDTVAKETAAVAEKVEGEFKTAPTNEPLKIVDPHSTDEAVKNKVLLALYRYKPATAPTPAPSATPADQKVEPLTECECHTCRQCTKFTDLPACGTEAEATFVPLMQKGVCIINPKAPRGMVPEFYTRQVCSLQKDKHLDLRKWVNSYFLYDIIKEARDKQQLKPKARVKISGGAYFRLNTVKVPGKVFLALFHEWINEMFTPEEWQRVIVFDDDKCGFTVCY